MSPPRRDTNQRPGGAGWHNASRLAGLVLCVALLASASHTVCAFTVTIAAAAPKTVYLQVGVGGFTGNYNAGGTPANNATAVVPGEATDSRLQIEDRKSTRLNSSH